MNNCTLLACQISIPVIRNHQDKINHIGQMIDKISAKLDKKQADIVVLPELCTIDYSRDTFEQLASLAESLDQHSVQMMRQLATRYKTTVVFGMPKREGGQYTISQLAIGANGDLMGCYDKLHICQYGASMEKEFFQAGRSLCTFDLAGFRFAPIICYDIRFPELSRTLTLDHQVDCILHCGAYFRDESFDSWHAFAVTRAMENQIYLLSLNRAGDDFGDSIFCPPWMDKDSPKISFSSHDEDFRYLTLHRSTITEARTQYPFLQDRLPDYAL